MYMDVLNRDLLLTLATVAIERVDQQSIGAGELVRLVEIFATALERLFVDHGASVAFHRSIVGRD